MIITRREEIKSLMWVNLEASSSYVFVRNGRVPFFYNAHAPRPFRFFIQTVNRVCNDATRLQPVFAIVGEIYHGEVSRMKNSN